MNGNQFRIKGQPGQFSGNEILVSHQNQWHPQFPGGQDRPFDYCGRRPISTHGIDGDLNGLHGFLSKINLTALNFVNSETNKIKIQMGL
jgi:hypothetical protein